MIQHNDSDTSCMRAFALLERTLASIAELFPYSLKLLCLAGHMCVCKVPLASAVASAESVVISVTAYWLRILEHHVSSHIVAVFI